MPANLRRPHARNLAIAFVVPLLIALMAGTWQTPVLAQSATLQLQSGTTTVAPGTQTTLTYSLTNSLGATTTFQISTTPPPGWTAQVSNPSITVNNGGTTTFTILLTVPASATAGANILTVTATGNGTPYNVFTTINVSSTTGQISLSPVIQTVTGNTGQTGVSINLTLTNSTTTQRSFNLTSSQLPNGIVVRFPINPVTVAANSTFQFPVLVDFGSDSATGTNIGTGRITATTSDTGPALSATAFLTFSVTAGPTPTPQGCPDTPDPGNDRSSAMLILVNASQRHGICGRGDEDWFKFGAVGNKVYTIDIPAMDAGLDLSLELYDSDGNMLTSNDDYFLRNPAAPDPKDIKPQIHSWRAPKDGTYYIRVRDNLNIGGGNTTYTIIVQAESYGPTPVTVTELCRDLFEEDGLPEQAKLITSNESQYGRVLCPTGDADWVKFFALRGKVYYIYTDTRPYKNTPDINNQTEAGADTVIYLADRDGVSILDFSDDVEGSLDSQLRFTPSADGFYYLQIKNVGDIGNQFIKYDLTLQLCLPNQECGRSPIAPAVAPTARVPSTGTTPQPTATTSVFINPTPTPTLQAAGNFSQSSLKPGPLVNGPLLGFADPAFERVWQRNDRPIAEQRASRSWLWGPHGLMARTEGYIQSASGLRQVQYFDKGRMEVNDPRGDRNSQWFVTTGLLVIELISGRTQIGDTQFVQHTPADIPIAGDPGDPNAPTYASFGGVSGQQPGDRTGQLAGETLSRAGQVGAYAGPQRPEARLVHFVPESGHNIPQIFWEYLNTSGTVYEGRRYASGTLLNWVFTLGYPISEAYWTRIKVGGVERDVLVQPFQRRVLTYSPDNPSGWQVEMGNVGRHYYLWRYGEDLPS